MPRIFLAHPISLSDTALTELKAEVQKLVARYAMDPNAVPEVVLGRDDYNERFAACGSWDNWIKEAAEGVITSFAGQEPRYLAYIVGPDATVGKATAQILIRAIAQGKQVALLRDGDLLPVNRVIRTDPRDFKSGWMVYALGE